ncbi:hypothetical protein [Rhizobium leguminosarum]|uniref:hypothetical protein n=1 Tax=Rhizobium leguminosarum TaxID=384 RepID=UPI001039FAA1|nr:hypothetical protein [Rhizobium leguminosarum]TBZ22261.1 hypothetical protein E0H38_09895 [Rhizobium leguminosarum bv. viciae]
MTERMNWRPISQQPAMRIILSRQDDVGGGGVLPGMGGLQSDGPDLKWCAGAAQTNELAQQHLRGCAPT